MTPPRRRPDVVVSPEMNLPYDVTLRLTDDGARYVVACVAIARKPGGPNVSSDGIRHVPIQRAVALAMREAYVNAVAGWTDVAAIYRTAFSYGLNPTRAVADTLCLPYSTAAKKIMRARADGLLGKVPPGRAGGI